LPKYIIVLKSLAFYLGVKVGGWCEFHRHRGNGLLLAVVKNLFGQDGALQLGEEGGGGRLEFVRRRLLWDGCGGWI
jgi:hypothetical protein